MFPLIGLLMLVQAQATDRSAEGNWYVADTTDNNTGAREVYAFATYLKANDPDYVTVRMSCAAGRPTIFVEWQDLPFPDQAVLTFGPVERGKNTEPAKRPYMFEKPGDDANVFERGMRATPETSAQIIAAFGQATYTTLTAHLSTGDRSVVIDVAGTQRAWSRVSRHCPVKYTALPPL